MIIRLTGLAILTAILAFAAVPAGSSVYSACGPIVHIQDPGLRASFEQFERTQSATAAKICSLYHNTVVASR